MAKTARESRDPRTYNQPLTYDWSEVAPKIDNAYRTGWQDSVNSTVDLASTENGRRALREVADGDPKSYRKAMARRRPIN